MILGLIKPTAGSIKINKDHNLDDKLYSWHRIISFMPQDIFTINDTISKNISLKESLNEKEIQNPYTFEPNRYNNNFVYYASEAKKNILKRHLTVVQ